MLIANNDELSTNPDRYKKALSAISQGYKYASAHPDESADILVKLAPETNAELAKASQTYMSKQYLADDGTWGKFDYARWDRFFTWVHEQKLINTAFAPQQGVTNDYLPD